MHCSPLHISAKKAVSILLTHAITTLCTKRENKLPATPWVSGYFFPLFIYPSIYLFIILDLVGEPINNEAWQWFYHVVGEGRCTLVDTWWQTGKRHPRGVCRALMVDREAEVDREEFVRLDSIQWICQKKKIWHFFQIWKVTGEFLHIITV